MNPQITASDIYRQTVAPTIKDLTSQMLVCAGELIVILTSDKPDHQQVARASALPTMLHNRGLFISSACVILSMNGKLKMLGEQLGAMIHHFKWENYNEEIGVIGELIVILAQIQVELE